MPNACNIMSRYSVRVAVHLQRGIQRHQCTSASHSSAFDLQDGNLEANTYSQQRQKREDDPPPPVFRASGQCVELLDLMTYTPPVV